MWCHCPCHRQKHFGLEQQQQQQQVVEEKAEAAAGAAQDRAGAGCCSHESPLFGMWSTQLPVLPKISAEAYTAAWRMYYAALRLAAAACLPRRCWIWWNRHGPLL